MHSEHSDSELHLHPLMFLFDFSCPPSPAIYRWLSLTFWVSSLHSLPEITYLVTPLFVHQKDPCLLVTSLIPRPPCLGRRRYCGYPGAQLIHKKFCTSLPAVLYSADLSSAFCQLITGACLFFRHHHHRVLQTCPFPSHLKPGYSPRLQ